MPPKTYRLLSIFLAALAASAEISFAQVPRTAFQIGTITPAFYATPAFTGAQYDKRVNASGKWMEIEVAFDWMPAVKAAYTDELTFNYYVLLNNAAATVDQKSSMLTGSETLVNIAPQRGMHTSMYISPNSLGRYFGRIPGSPTTALIDVGVTVSIKGQIVAESSWKGRGEWWTPLTPTAGVLLPRSATPFASLGWDYFEETKFTPAH